MLSPPNCLESFLLKVYVKLSNKLLQTYLKILYRHHIISDAFEYVWNIKHKMYFFVRFSRVIDPLSNPFHLSAKPKQTVNTLICLVTITGYIRDDCIYCLKGSNGPNHQLLKHRRTSCPTRSILDANWLDPFGPVWTKH